MSIMCKEVKNNKYFTGLANNKVTANSVTLSCHSFAWTHSPSNKQLSAIFSICYNLAQSWWKCCPRVK